MSHHSLVWLWCYLESFASRQVYQHQLAILLHGRPSSHAGRPGPQGPAPGQEGGGLKLKRHDAVATRRILVQPVRPAVTDTMGELAVSGLCAVDVLFLKTGLTQERSDLELERHDAVAMQ